MPRDDAHRWTLAWVASGLVLVGVVVFLQQFTRGLRETTFERAAPEVRESERLDPPGVSELTLLSKMAAKLAYFARTKTREPFDGAELMREIDAVAVRRAERLRAAIVAGELLGKEQASRRVEGLLAEVAPDGDIARELAWLRELYAKGRAGVPEDAQQSLIDRHGWFGRLALSQGMSDYERYRREVLYGIERVGAVVLALGGLGLLVVVSALVVFILACMAWRQGALASGFETGPAGPEHLELSVLFVGGFMLVLSGSLLAFGLGAEATTGALVVQQVLLWGLAAVLVWPAIRRLPWRHWADEVGLHGGAGVVREAWYGVLGWLAGLPLVVGASIVVGMIEGGEGAAEEASPARYPLFEPPPGGGVEMLVLGTLSAVVWAPLVEEVVFRGALYRWLRGRLRAGLTIVITALLFGLVHPYSPSGLATVSVMGVVFGLLREWRGSLIASITAHALHNATICGVTIAFVVAIGD